MNKYSIRSYLNDGNDFTRGGDNMTKVKSVKYPRVYISPAIHLKLQRIAKKQNKALKEIGNKIVLAGIKALGL
jgi:hypothetical protein